MSPRMVKEARVRFQKGRLARCGRVFILGLAAFGFESPSLLRLLNELRFCVLKSLSNHSYGIYEDARISAKRQVLGSRIRVFDTMPRDLEISVMSLGQDLGLITALGGGGDEYFSLRSRIVFDLIPSCFK
ncbi:hypothetical protein F2Q69_00027907 [Brassica cretica]|uniref:Uncharacterized protein n=1 Tax=Brassica cretica TaxID=69181 RepID=A0A8S9RZA1_BRACR|nr:hypothetical protein F2Q69_00027907 [Brassica cretica]